VLRHIDQGGVVYITENDRFRFDPQEPCYPTRLAEEFE
jgi:hypothetical protein